MQLKAYGTPDPLPDDNPLNGRSSSLEYSYKKALSHFFMPNNLMQWNELASVGNPTKSTAVNPIIKRVKKKEVRREGVPSQARKHFELEEFKAVIRALEEIDQDELRLFTSGIFRYQFSMVGRIDCSAHFQVANFWKNPQHPEFSILNRLCWSKNVHEERNAPTQILIGATDSNFCVLLGLASWLEFSIAKYGKSQEWFWNYQNLDDPDSIKNRADTQLKKVLNSPAFTRV